MDVTRLDIQQEISNTQTVSIVEEKLPRDVKLAWSKRVIKKGSTIDLDNKFPKLLEFLQERRRLIEYENADIRLPEKIDIGSMHHVNRTNLIQLNPHQQPPLHTELPCFHCDGYESQSRAP